MIRSSHFDFRSAHTQLASARQVHPPTRMQRRGPDTLPRRAAWGCCCGPDGPEPRGPGRPRTAWTRTCGTTCRGGDWLRPPAPPYSIPTQNLQCNPQLRGTNQKVESRSGDGAGGRNQHCWLPSIRLHGRRGWGQQYKVPAGGPAYRCKEACMVGNVQVDVFERRRWL